MLKIFQCPTCRESVSYYAKIGHTESVRCGACDTSYSLWVCRDCLRLNFEKECLCGFFHEIRQIQVKAENENIRIAVAAIVKVHKSSEETKAEVKHLESRMDHLNRKLDVIIHMLEHLPPVCGEEYLRHAVRFEMGKDAE